MFWEKQGGWGRVVLAPYRVVSTFDQSKCQKVYYVNMCFVNGSQSGNVFVTNHNL